MAEREKKEMNGQTGAVRSKYAEKVAARKAQAVVPELEGDAPSAVEVAEEAMVREGFADLGKLAEVCAKNLREAREKVNAARSVAKEMVRRAANGLQRQEPNALVTMLGTMEGKIRWMEARAERVR